MGYTVEQNTMRNRWPLALLLGFLAASRAGTLAHAAEEAEGIAFFEARIRPVLVMHCYKCHSAESQAKDTAWPRSEIDHFILARLESAGLHPVADADSYTLVRRLYFDLIGLPPTAEDLHALVQQFSASLDEAETPKGTEREKAYEALLD